MLKSLEMQGLPSHGSPVTAGLIAVLGAVFPLVVVKAFDLSISFLLPLEVFSIWMCAFPALRYLYDKSEQRLAFWPYFAKGTFISALFLFGILGINYLF